MNNERLHKAEAVAAHVRQRLVGLARHTPTRRTGHALRIRIFRGNGQPNGLPRSPPWHITVEKCNECTKWQPCRRPRTPRQMVLFRSRAGFYGSSPPGRAAGTGLRDHAPWTNRIDEPVSSPPKRGVDRVPRLFERGPTFRVWGGLKPDPVRNFSRLTSGLSPFF